MAARVNVLNEAHGAKWAAYNADCVDFVRQMPSDSVDLTVYSPPFGDLFVYSDSEADMGNSSGNGEFFTHYSFLIKEKLRVTKPGRLSAVHCSDLPARKWIDGHISVVPFSDAIVRAHLAAGWLLHCRVTVWKDPVVEMQRTKALGLLYKQIKKDSAMSRMGMPDYVLVFRKPGENAAPIEHRPEEFPVALWQKWASPVWMDVSQTNVLNGRVAREDKDEKHICPLQLDLIERCVTLWSNKGETVFSPFLGIGSEGHVSLKLGRRFLGTELKEAYWRQACRYLDEAEREVDSGSLFDMLGDVA
jgi:hypothetical protein